MGIDKSEAAAALAAAGQSQQRSEALYGYRFNAPLLMLWGVIWLSVDLTMAFAPSVFVLNWGWTIGSILGAILSAVYSWRYSVNHGRRLTDSPKSRAYFWRMMGTWLASIVFIIMALTIFAPFEWRDIHAFWAIFIAMIYTCYGVWNGWRMAVVGVLLGVLSMFAFFTLVDRDYLIFMGAVCGGGMIAGGLWLRTA